MDPLSVSHNSHRIGHRFREDILQQACTELDYVNSDGKFIKQAELATHYENSMIGRALAKYGMPYQQSTSQDESEPKIRSAIRELFPKIPDADLDAVIRRAWEKGTNAVGNNTSLDLSYRVQLAVGAHARHVHTDYDYLLRALKRPAARQEVEKDTLAKLLEWRGEDNDTEDVTAIRETIVIDDSDGDEQNPVVIDDSENVEDSDSFAHHNKPIHQDTGHNNDIRPETSQPPATLNATEPYYHRHKKNVEERHFALDQQIRKMREQIRHVQVSRPDPSELDR